MDFERRLQPITSQVKNMSGGPFPESARKGILIVKNTSDVMEMLSMDSYAPLPSSAQAQARARALTRGREQSLTQEQVQEQAPRHDAWESDHVLCTDLIYMAQDIQFRNFLRDCCKTLAAKMNAIDYESRTPKVIAEHASLFAEHAIRLYSVATFLPAASQTVFHAQLVALLTAHYSNSAMFTRLAVPDALH